MSRPIAVPIWDKLAASNGKCLKSGSAETKKPETFRSPAFEML